MLGVRPIDANALFEFIQKEKAWKQSCIQRYRYNEGKYDAYYEMLDIIKEQSTLDYEPVVHCKECKHHIMLNSRIMCARVALRVQGNYYGLSAVKENHFCGYGAKMDEEVKG